MAMFNSKLFVYQRVTSSNNGLVFSPENPAGNHRFSHFFLWGFLSGWWYTYPLWKTWKSVGILIPNLWKNKIHVISRMLVPRSFPAFQLFSIYKIHVPNHQPAVNCQPIHWIQPATSATLPLCHLSLRLSQLGLEVLQLLLPGQKRGEIRPQEVLMRTCGKFIYKI